MVPGPGDLLPMAPRGVRLCACWCACRLCPCTCYCPRPCACPFMCPGSPKGETAKFNSMTELNEDYMCPCPCMRRVTRHFGPCCLTLNRSVVMRGCMWGEGRCPPLFYTGGEVRRPPFKPMRWLMPSMAHGSCAYLLLFSSAGLWCEHDSGPSVKAHSRARRGHGMQGVRGPLAGEGPG